MAPRGHPLAGQFAGIGFFHDDRLDEARTVLRQASSIDAGLPLHWFYLGECERLAGNQQEARAAYRRCLQLAPAHGRARMALLRMGETP